MSAITKVGPKEYYIAIDALGMFRASDPEYLKEVLNRHGYNWWMRDHSDKED